MVLLSEIFPHKVRRWKLGVESGLGLGSGSGLGLGLVLDLELKAWGEIGARAKARVGARAWVRVGARIEFSAISATARVSARVTLGLGQGLVQPLSSLTSLTPPPLPYPRARLAHSAADVRGRGGVDPNRLPSPVH